MGEEKRKKHYIRSSKREKLILAAVNNDSLRVFRINR
jgi:hypothetical protein